MARFLFIVLFLCSVSGYAEVKKPLSLSLNEAILLAVRENPNIQQAQLNHVSQKFALDVQKWQFQPHFQINATKSTTKTVSVGNPLTSQSWGIAPQMSWQSPIGTQVQITSGNTITEHYNPTLSAQIVQPLMRGFGKPIVEAALYNAIDSEYISKLNIQNALRNIVTEVINAYLDVVAAKHVIDIDESALKRALKSVEQTRLFIKAGRKAGVELVTVQADVARAEAQLETDKNALDQARYALLTAIGIDPNTQIAFTNIDLPALIKKFVIPPLEDTKTITLENDIQYQIDQITLHGSTKRNVLSAEDNARWQLNLSVNVVRGGGTGGGNNAGTNSLLNGYNQNQNATLNLTIPIDDRNAKQAILNAKIALKEAEIALTQEKWAKQTNAINNWNSIYSSKRTLFFAEDAKRLQEKTYQISYQKYSHGLIDSLELQSAQQRLIDREQALLVAKISYLKALVKLDQQLGKTLKTWHVEIRYS